MFVALKNQAIRNDEPKKASEANSPDCLRQRSTSSRIWGLIAMALRDVLWSNHDREEWSGGARANVWGTQYLFDTETGEVVVEEWKVYSDARSRSAPTRERLSVERVARDTAPHDVVAKLVELGL
jgi:hypothetical protein